MEGSTPKKKIPAGLIAGLTIAALAVSLGCGYLGLCTWVQDNGRLLPGAVAVDDQGEVVADLGKLTREDALDVVTREMDQRLDNRKLTLLYGEGKRMELTGELMACAPEAAVDVGFAVKEAQPLWKLGALWMGAAQEPADLSLSAAAFTEEGRDKARDAVRSIANELYLPPEDFTYEMGEESVTVIPGSDGQMVDAEALLTQVEEALAQGADQLTVEPQPLPGAELSGEVLNKLVYVEPKAAGVDENGKLSPAVIGLSVNAEEAQSILDGAVPGEPCTIPLEYTPPGTSADEAMFYKDLLATVTTTVSGTSDRFHNVALAASFCNGKVLQPGEVFSYLGAVSPISVSHGFHVGTGYQGGQTVDMVGGGVCQMSSSLYYCAVYANLEIVKRACHAFATGYIPNGLDATVYAPSLDFKFRNNTGFPIKIMASMSGKKLTVQFYGSNPDGIRVETERYTRSSTPWTTVYQPDETIPRGTTKVDVTPYTGYEVDVYRCVYDASGKRISRTFENHSRYAKRDKVILYNPADEGPWGPAVGPAVTEPPVPPTQEPTPTEPVPTQDPWVEPTPDLPVDPTPEPTPSSFIDLPEPTPDIPAEPSPGPENGGWNGDWGGSQPSGWE